jgi:DNA replication protein DnaC
MMGCPREISELARRRLDERREQCHRRAAVVRNAIAISAPKALEIEKEIAKTSSMLAKAALSGGNVAEKVRQIQVFNLKKQQELTDVLMHAGFEGNALSPSFYCERCKDTGIIQTKICDCVKKIERELLLERLGASASQDCTFQDFNLDYYDKNPKNGFSPYEKMSRAFHMCQNFAESFSTASSSLLLTGGAGLGKTHLSLSIAREVIDKGFDVFYIPFLSLLTRLEVSRFGRNETDYSEYLITPLNCELLILDDLGSEFSSPFGSSILYHIINNRLLYKLPTIINTNLDHTEISRRYGERIGSRLLGCYQVVLFAGEDVRLQKMFKK